MDKPELLSLLEEEIEKRKDEAFPQKRFQQLIHLRDLLKDRPDNYTFCLSLEDILLLAEVAKGPSMS